MNNWMQIIWKLLIAIALIVIPFSMSHASMGHQPHEMQLSQTMTHDNHMTMGHDDHNRSSKDRNSYSHQDNHSDHDSADCCSSVCGGALTIELDHSSCQPISGAKLAFKMNSLEPGEWVLPFRPPSI